MNKNVHIFISQTTIPGVLPTDLDFNLIAAPELNIEHHEAELTPFASLEWTIPPLIAAFFLKPYFDGFLEAAGGNHYTALKDWVIKQHQKFRDQKTVTVRATQSPKKALSDRKSPNNFFAVYFEIPSGNRLKIFMPEAINEGKEVKAIANLLDDLIKLYDKPNSKFSNKIMGLISKPYDELYVIYNDELSEWEFFTTSMLIQMSRNDKPSIH